MKLYWVTTEDHDEDWFMVASSLKEAAKLHEEMEGYEPGDAKAEEILAIKGDVPAEAGWPSDELLLAVGAKILHNEQPRVVEIRGREFHEGMLDAVLDELRHYASDAGGDERLKEMIKPSLN